MATWTVTYPDATSWQATSSDATPGSTVTVTADTGDSVELTISDVATDLAITLSAASMLLAAGVPLVVRSAVLTAQAAAMLMLAGRPTVTVMGLSPFKAPDGTPLPLKVWTGTRWVEVPLRLWNGSMFN